MVIASELFIPIRLAALNLVAITNDCAITVLDASSADEIGPTLTRGYSNSLAGTYWARLCLILVVHTGKYRRWNHLAKVDPRIWVHLSLADLSSA